MSRTVGERANQVVTKKFPTTLERLYDMLDFVRKASFQLRFSREDVEKIELATEEAIVNIISYGFPNQSEGEIEISCAPHTDSKGILITIKDEGISYNPLTNKHHYKTSATIEQRSAGGWGIHFILKLMDEVNYKRDKEFNVLTLIKYQ